MSDLPINILVPVGVIIASTIAGLFSYISLVLSKEQKISEFRQKWTDELRSEIGEYISSLIIVSSIKKDNPNPSDDVFLTPQTNLSLSYTKIYLRLNPDDGKKHVKALIQDLTEIKEYVSKHEWENVDSKVDDVRSNSRKLLKEEWSIIKKGEPAFRYSKYIVLVIALIVPISLGPYIYQVFNADITQSCTDEQKTNKQINKD